MIRLIFLLAVSLSFVFEGGGATATAGAAVQAAATAPLSVVAADGKRHGFRVEIAATPETRMRGLMFRRSLPADGGMLFDLGRSEPIAMWMKDTFIPLDMLFLDETGRIVHIAERTVPHSLEAISPGRPVRAVLEVNGGTAARLGLRAGDRVLHPIFGTAP